MSASKKRAAPRPPTNGVSSPVKAKESNGTTSVGDGFIDKTIELTVVLPDQSQEKIHIVPSTALFDLRTQLCGKYKLNPSSHKLEPVDKNGRAISCTSSSTVESSEAVAVHLIPRLKDMPKITPVKTVEQTVRLTVKTSQAHQQVVRVKPNVPLRTILNDILDKTNSSKENHKFLELRHPLKTKEALDLSKSLDEYNKLREVFVVDARDKQAAVTRDGSTKKKKKIKSLFKFGKKKSKGQIVSPTSTSPPVSISEEPEFFNEKGVDTEALESGHPSHLKHSRSQQNESLHGQVSAKMQERNTQGSSEGLNEDESDGKKKAPAPPTPSLPTSHTESTSPSSPNARPEKPPRRQSIEKQKGVSESQSHDGEIDGEIQKDVGAPIDVAKAAETITASVDDVSISSAEETGTEIAKEEEMSEGRHTPDAIDSEITKVLDVIQISEQENVENPSASIEDSDTVSQAASDKGNDSEISATKDDAVLYDKEIAKETERVVEVVESAAMTSSANSDTISQQSQKLEVPDNTEHHVITPGLGFEVKDVITEDDLKDLSDSEIPAMIDEESDTEDDKPNHDEEKTLAVDLSLPTISDMVEEKENPEQELLPPTSFSDERPPSSATVNENVAEPTVAVTMEKPSSNLQDTKPSPELERPVTTSSQQPVEKAVSKVNDEPLQPPPLKDDDNLFTTPSDYDVYEEPEVDMAFIETQALAIMQQFANGTTDDKPLPVVDIVEPVSTPAMKTQSKEPSPASITKDAMPATISAKKTEFQAANTEQEVDGTSDEQTKEEIAKLKAQLEIAKQKLAQKEAEAEYARKNPYTIVPEQKPEAGQVGKRKTLTFVPTQRPVRSFEDYETAPQTVISITKGGDIRGMVLVKDKKQEDKGEVKPSPSNEKTMPIVSTSSTLASNADVQPPSKTTVPVVKKAPATAIVTNNQPRSNDTKLGNTETPTVASIMVNHLQSTSTPRQEIPDVKIMPSQSAEYRSNQPSVGASQPKTDAVTRKPAKVAGGYVGSAILKQPAPVNSKSSVPSVYDWTSNKKSSLPNYYKRFLGIDAVTGTNKAVDKFKSNVEEKRSIPIGDFGASNQRNVTQPPTTGNPPSPTKPAVAVKPVSLGVESNSSSYSQSPTSPIAASLNKALNPSPVTSLPLPPEEKSRNVVNNYQFDGTALPPPPEEFLSPTNSVKSLPVTAPSVTSPKTGTLSPSYVGISSAKPFGSSASGGPKFRPMSAAFKSGKSNKASSP